MHLQLGGGPGADPGHAAEIMSLSWLPEELTEAAGEREVWASLLKLLPP